MSQLEGFQASGVAGTNLTNHASSGLRRAASHSRRTFLVNVSEAAVAVSASLVAVGPLASPAHSALSIATDEEGSSLRAGESFELRVNAAVHERTIPSPPQITNGDEFRYSNFVGNFSKGLAHSSTGEVDANAYHLLLQATRTGTSDAFESVPLGGTVELVNPLAGLAFDLEGSDSHQLSIPPPPTLASQTRADEMVELYCMALCRDVNFTDYSANPIAQAAAKELSSITAFPGPKPGGQVTAQSLFRGFMADDVFGPFVSQLFQTPFVYGQFELSGQVTTHQPSVDYLTTQAEWLACQNGQGPFVAIQFDPVPRYYRNGRDLGAYVHVDHICEAFYNAALRLYGVGAPPDPGNPYRNRKKQAPFGTFGEPHFLSMHGEFALRALKAVWYQKWFVHRTLRPEAFGGLVHMTKTGQARYPIHPDVLNSQALEQTLARYGSYFLSSAFPEGCPQHPSYAQAHGSVAGACATFLKAAFDGSVQYNTLPHSAI